MIETVGHYKILDTVGSGSLGEVYRARDTRHGRTVAIRMLGADFVSVPALRERLLARARPTAALSHPNIATLYEIGEDAGRPFLVYEFAAGESLGALIGGQPLNPRRAVDLGAQLADALAEAHAEGLVCGALAAGNIVVTPKGNAKILDFGLAAISAGTRSASSEPSADLSALGALLFHMLTGKPYAGATDRALPAELDQIVSKALGTSPDGAYEAAATLAAELRAVGAMLEVRAGAAPPVDVPVVARQARRTSSRWVWLAIAAVGLAAVWYLGS